MSEEKTSTSKSTKTETKTAKVAPPAKESSGNGGKNGKGDTPRNIFSKKFLGNYDRIDWGK